MEPCATSEGMYHMWSARPDGESDRNMLDLLVSSEKKEITSLRKWRGVSHRHQHYQYQPLYCSKNSLNGSDGRYWHCICTCTL